MKFMVKGNTRCQLKNQMQTQAVSACSQSGLASAGVCTGNHTGLRLLWGSWAALNYKTLRDIDRKPFHNVKCFEVVRYVKNGRLAADKHLKMN